MKCLPYAQEALQFRTPRTALAANPEITRFFNRTFSWSDTMRFIFSIIIAGTLCCFAMACTPVQRGATDEGFIVGGQPNIAISVSPELDLQRTGEKSVVLDTDTVHSTSARMTYAVFGNTKDSRVARHAHTFSINPSTRNWRFSPETYTSRYGISTTKQKINGQHHTIQTLLVPAKDDWFSDLWQENGVLPPESWLAMRWSTTPNNLQRVVAEYREPMPPCIRSSEAWRALVSQETVPTIYKQQLWQQCNQEFEDFTQRANSTIHFDRLNESSPLQTSTTLKIDSSHRPNFTHQAGELEENNKSNDRYKK